MFTFETPDVRSPSSPLVTNTWPGVTFPAPTWQAGVRTMRTKKSNSGLVVYLTAAALAVAAAATTATTSVYHDMTIQAIVHPVTTVGSATTSGMTSAVYHDM
ncbi:hypothetical protein [Rhizomonospora bruguierae]|uniref:hypothetical protein n=1 Tax=Rhizomonospora bruguierae TaxID=1581705 RepID=UPI001BCEAD63|nr:hypothetical protein [Micromonospora sp. NBRC 107566]